MLRITDEFHEIIGILTELGRRLPQLRENPLYAASIPHYLSSGAYKFVIEGPDGADATIENASAFGFVTFYRAPMMERIALAVEAFWFASDDLEAQRPVWMLIAKLAKSMDFHGVCISERSVNTPTALHRMVREGEIQGNPVGLESILLQADVHGIYSSFADGPLKESAFVVRCVRIYTLKVPIDLAGVPCADDGPFYRGEGRLVNLPHWRCESVDELGLWFIRNGFQAREDGRFDGTVQSQILQQGYVNQPTLSLTKSFDVAAYYATGARARSEAVVFTIDGERLKAFGNVYDSFATMSKHCDWILPGEFTTLRRVVTALGVLKAGRFLADCNDTARNRVEQHGHLPDAFAPKINWDSYFDRNDWERLESGSVDSAALNGVQNAFEGFWMFALGQVGSVDTIRLDPDEQTTRVESRPVDPLGYYLAFEHVEAMLKEALEGATGDHRQPGWDLTPFGYIAKTCRDEEFFSSGPIPGECIARATVVTDEGKSIRVIGEQ